MYKIFKVSSNEITHGNNLMAGNTDIVSWTDDLSSLIDGRGMFSGCSNLETFTSDLSSLEIATEYEEQEIPFSLLVGNMLPDGSLEGVEDEEFLKFYFGFPEGVGIDDVIMEEGSVSGMMFNGCKNLTQFNSNLSNLEDGRGMFNGCSNLKTFTSDLSSLKYGGGMFSNCYELTSFDADLSSLEEGFGEFRFTKFKTLDGEEIKLGGVMGMLMGMELANANDVEGGNGGGMFRNCTSLETFDTDLSALKNGTCMFSGCSNLKTFTSDLSSLINGAGMFSGCSKIKTFTSNLSSLVDWGMGSVGLGVETGGGDDGLGDAAVFYFSMINVDIPQGMFDFYEVIPANLSINFGQLRNAQCLFREYPEEIDFGTLNIDLSAVEGGQGMFFGSSITGFTQDLPSLKYGGGVNEMDFDTLMTFMEAEGESTDMGMMVEFMGADALAMKPKLFCPSMGFNGTFEQCLNLQSFNGNLSSLKDGRQMFNGCVSLETFTSNLSSLSNGINMFNNCFTLSEFNVDNLNSLVIGGQFMMSCDMSTYQTSPCGGMFSNCYELTSFDVDLNSLEQGDAMFFNCICLESFSSLMPNLKSAIAMFNGCTALTSFDVDLSNLTNGPQMFSGCSNLKTFTSDLSSLANGSQMFSGCATLTSFDADLSSLITGVDMFKNCALNVESIERIVNYINDISALDKNDASLWNGLNLYSRGTITIGEASDVTIEQLTDYGLRLMNKGWRVIFNKVSFGIGLSITEENYYIPDASGWKSNIPTDSPLYSSIGGVIDNKFYDKTGSVLYDLDGEELTVDSDNIITAKNMLENTYTLLGWDSPLSKLKDAHSMFKGCYNMTSFESDLSSISDGRYMFSDCYNMTSFEANISSLEYGNYMFYNCKALTCSIDYDMSSLINGSYMFYNCTNLTSFNSDLSNLPSGDYMFGSCTNLTTFSSDLSSLTNGSAMFQYCSNLTLFSSDLSNLTSGVSMFYGCSNLTSFSSNLASLTNGDSMFYKCSNLTSFTSDLSNLTKGDEMFYKCSNLTSFFGNTSSLIDGTNMFTYTKLSSFTGDLSSLLTGEDMFYGCPLNPTSFTLISNSIKDISKLDRTKDEDWQGIPSSKRGILSICCDLDSFVTAEQMGKAEMTMANFLTKGWGLKFSFMVNGSLEVDNAWMNGEDIKKGGFFIPDASRWNDLVGQDITLQTVINEVGTYGTSSTIEVDSSEIKIANYLMNGNTSFTTWDSPLTRLESGRYMFYNCTALSSFTSDLRKLEDGYYMFYNCTALTSFTSDLNSLSTGYRMFYNCTALTSFTSDLSSLLDGDNMFMGCKLDATSVKNILDTINALGGGSHSISIGINVNSAVTDGKDTATQLSDFAQAMGFSTFDEVRTAFSDKGWSVTFQYGGTTTTIN